MRVLLGSTAKMGAGTNVPVSYTHLDVYKRQVYPIYRAERKEQFEQLLRADRRNSYYTEFLPIDPDKAEQDLRDVLAHGLMDDCLLYTSRCV